MMRKIQQRVFKVGPETAADDMRSNSEHSGFHAICTTSAQAGSALPAIAGSASSMSSRGGKGTKQPEAWTSQAQSDSFTSSLAPESALASENISTSSTIALQPVQQSSCPSQAMSMPLSLPPLLTRISRHRNSACIQPAMIVNEEDVQKERMHDILEATDGLPWHVVNSIDSPCRIDEIIRSIEASMDASQEFTAIILPADLNDLQFAVELTDRICSSVDADTTSQAARQSMPPIVVVLHAEKSKHVSDENILDAQELLLDKGAEEVMWKCGSTADLRVSIAMSVTRAHAARKEFQQTEQHYEHKVGELYQALQQQVEREQGEPSCGMFWQTVHHFLRGFPRLESHARLEDMHLDNLKFEGKLGRGTFGCVYSATREGTLESEAVKVVEKNILVELSDVKSIWREISALSRLNHENIIKLYGAVHGPNHLFIRLEHAGDTNLCNALRRAGGRFSPTLAHHCQVQLASAVAYCHASGIAHRDLKPENICLRCDGSFTIKLLDFGECVASERLVGNIAGTMPFMAPEVQEASEETPYSPAGGDVWACGVILLEMLCGISTMNRMLGWSGRVQPSTERAAELRTFFYDPAGFSRFFNAQLGDAGVIGGEDPNLEALLVGMFHADPRHRWTASQAEHSQWVQEGPLAKT